MKIQILSDLHFDCLPGKQQETIVSEIIDPSVDYVVLAGDIAESDKLPNFVEKFNETGKKAIYVPGNHDLYRKDVMVFKTWVKNLFEKHGHHALVDDYVIIEDLLFVGGTLWTNIPDSFSAYIVKSGMLDFRRVQGISIDWWVRSHLHTKGYIEEVLKFEQFKDYKKIVVTHHSPTFQVCPEKYLNDSMNIAYHSNLDEFLSSEYAPDIWIHGHIHEFVDKMVGNTRVIRNPYGYQAYGEVDTEYKQYFAIDTNDQDSYLHPDRRSRTQEAFENTD